MEASVSGGQVDVGAVESPSQPCLGCRHRLDRSAKRISRAPPSGQPPIGDPSLIAAAAGKESSALL